MDFLSKHWLEIIEMLGFIGGVVSLTLASKPSPSEEKESERKYFEYPSGYEFIQKKYTVRLGKIPFFNKISFRKIKLDSFPFFDATFRLFFCGLEQRIPLEQKKDWMTKNEGDHKCIYIKKLKIPFESSFNVVLEILKERTKDYIDQKVDKDITSQIDRNFITITISIRNDWSMTIKDYEVAYPVPNVKGLKILYARKKTEKEEDINLKEQDVTLHLQDMVSNIKKRQNLKLGSISKFILKIYLDIEPGITEIAFRYKK